MQNYFMGDVKNLSNENAIEKLKELANDETCMFCTYTDETDIISRPMSTQVVDEVGNIWFFSGKSSNKNNEIKMNPKVYLQFSNPGKQNYLAVSGEAEIITDRNKIKEFWNPIVKAWFTGGQDDPEISLLKITPTDAYYWDTRHGKMVAFIKILASAITGKTMDDGIEGSLKV